MHKGMFINTMSMFHEAQTVASINTMKSQLHDISKLNHFDIAARALTFKTT